MKIRQPVAMAPHWLSRISSRIIRTRMSPSICIVETNRKVENTTMTTRKRRAVVKEEVFVVRGWFDASGIEQSSRYARDVGLDAGLGMRKGNKLCGLFEVN